MPSPHTTGGDPTPDPAGTGAGQFTSPVITFTVDLDPNTNKPSLSASPDGGNIDIAKGHQNVLLTFKLVDNLGKGYTFKHHADNDPDGDHYCGIDIVGDDRKQFRDVHIDKKDWRTVTFKDNNTNSTPFPYTYIVTVENGVDEELTLDPTITNRGK